MVGGAPKCCLAPIVIVSTSSSPCGSRAGLFLTSLTMHCSTNSVVANAEASCSAKTNSSPPQRARQSLCRMLRRMTSATCLRRVFLTSRLQDRG
jgi:hypothetical protein